MISQFSEKEVKFLFLFSFMFCGIGVWSFRRHSSENSRSFGIFFRWGRELKGESEFGPLMSIRWIGAPPLLPSPSRPLSLSPIVADAPSLFLSSPFAAALYPLHDFLLPLDLLPHSKDREEEEHVEMKRKRGSRRCSSPSLLEDFLGENPRYG